MHQIESLAVLLFKGMLVLLKWKWIYVVKKDIIIAFNKDTDPLVASHTESGKKQKIIGSQKKS